MSPLSDVASLQNDVLLAPRFGILQQKADGSEKVRPIDHFSWSSEGKSKQQKKLSSVNSAYDTDETITHETLDDLAHTMKRFHNIFGCAPGLYKADIDSAFRRIPIKVQDRWASGIAMKVDGQVFCFASLPHKAWRQVGLIFVGQSCGALRVSIRRNLQRLCVGGYRRHNSWDCQKVLASGNPSLRR
jgi:hypothetical protein